jgi:hypothetical protein
MYFEILQEPVHAIRYENSSGSEGQNEKHIFALSKNCNIKNKQLIDAKQNELKSDI